MPSIVYGFLGLFVGLAVATAIYFVLKKRAEKDESTARERADALLERAEKKAREMERKAEDNADDIKKRANEYENETRQLRNEVQKQEQRLIKREEGLDRKGDVLTNKDLDLQNREKILTRREQEVERLTGEYQTLTKQMKDSLEKIAGMSTEEAKQFIVSELVAEAKLDAAKELRVIESEARETAEKQAKKILSTALARYAGEYVSEQVVTVISLPNEEMKGRIIGREGRNIRAFEAATGIDLIIDDTPEAVVVSGFSAVRREIARLSLEKLVSDGRIHPSRIEEVVKKTQKEVDQLVKEAGERAAEEMGIYGLHVELIKHIGRLRYRTSYGQNVLAHSIEVAYLAGLLAAELGFNEKIARRAGLLHDIGKAADQELEGPHHVVGSQLAKRFGESAQVVSAIKNHHEEPESVLDHIIIAADATSGARPGARRELLESYLKRLEDLEAIPKTFAGVHEAYAYQAGREIRVLVNPDDVSDDQLIVLTRDIAAKIEQELTYPGRIKVSLIRQTRAEDFAK